MARDLANHGQLVRRQPHTYTRTIATEPSLTSRKKPESHAQDGRPASVLAITTTTVGTIFSAVSGVTTSCSTTMATEPSQTQRGKRDCTANRCAGDRAVPFSIT